ncbi:MAG: hypothetical protein ACKVLC_08095 [Phycisphaerales bacterium]
MSWLLKLLTTAAGLLSNSNWRADQASRAPNNKDVLPEPDGPVTAVH